MKKALLNPITVAAQMAAEAASKSAAADPAQPTNEAQTTSIDQEAAASTASASTSAAASSSSSAPSAVEVLQGQLAQAQETLLEVKMELRESKAKLAQAEAGSKGLRAVVEESVSYLQIALGLPGTSASALTDEQLLAEQTRLKAQFDANFKAGGVAALSAADDAGNHSVDDARIVRVKAASLTKRK